MCAPYAWRMSQITRTTTELPLSVARRLAHLEPALQILWTIIAEAVSEETERQYRLAYERMRLRGLLPEQIGARSRRSFNFYRAALVYCSIERLAELDERLRLTGATISPKRAHQLLDLIEMELAVLADYPPNAKNCACRWQRPGGKRVRHSKRNKLSTLPANWRLRMLRACTESSRYFAAMLVLTLTGLRPAELAKGVRVAMAGATEIMISIRGAKVTAIAGQPIRHLWFAIDNPITRRLAQMVEASGGDTGLIVSIASAGALTGFVRRLSRRVFSRHRYIVSPYSFRHAFASDRKAEGVSLEDLAAMLGHATDRSQRGYGSANQGRPLGRMSGFSATREVRAVPASKEAVLWVAAKTSLVNGHTGRHSVTGLGGIRPSGHAPAS